MTRYARFALVLPAALLVLAACGSEDPAPSAPAASAPAGLTAQETAFVAKLATIAPPLAEDPERAANRGGNTCSDLTAKDAATGKAWTADKIAAQAADRFSGGSYTVTSAQAQQIVEAARETICAQ